MALQNDRSYRVKALRLASRHHSAARKLSEWKCAVVKHCGKRYDTTVPMKHGSRP